MTAWELALAMLAGFGHAALGLGAFNRLHALPLPQTLIDACEKGLYLALLAVPAFALWAASYHRFSLLDPWQNGDFWPLWLYAALCWGIALGPGLLWLLRPDAADPPDVLVSSVARHRDLAAELDQPLLHSGTIKILGRLPGNQILKLEINEKTLRLPNLPPELEGLAIVHLSDLHFTGQIDRAYFDCAIAEANRMEGDLVAVTGDIVDVPACLGWIPDTLGRLRSCDGVYGVLGNHDKRIRDLAHLRQTLDESGVTLLGGRWLERSVRGVPVVLAGDERPWFGPAPDLSASPPAAQRFRILLAHTPDRLPWAQENEFPLMLAGHNHGGQIRLPLLGPLVAPSRYGVKYASGAYREGGTVLHVSRGLGALHPLRFNCLPELTRLVLTRAGGSDG